MDLFATFAKTFAKYNEYNELLLACRPLLKDDKSIDYSIDQDIEFINENIQINGKSILNVICFIGYIFPINQRL